MGRCILRLTLVPLFIMSLSQVYGICMEWNVRNENGKVECKICIECGAGEETSPPCHTAEIFDASSFSGGCIPCKDKHYKAIQNGKNNTLNCKPCAKESCGNRTVLAECSKTSPLICSKCNKGYFENSAGTCREISSSSTPAKTRGTPTTWRAFTTTVKTPKDDTDSNKKDNDQRKDDKNDSNGSKSVHWHAYAGFGVGFVVGCIVVGFLVYCCRQRAPAWCNRCRTRDSDEGQQPNNNVNQPANSTPGGTTDNHEMDLLVDSGTSSTQRPTTHQRHLHQPEDSGTSSTHRPTTRMVDIERGQQPNNNVNQPASLAASTSAQQPTNTVDRAEGLAALGSEGQPLLNSMPQEVTPGAAEHEDPIPLRQAAMDDEQAHMLMGREDDERQRLAVSSAEDIPARCDRLPGLGYE